MIKDVLKRVIGCNLQQVTEICDGLGFSEADTEELYNLCENTANRYFHLDADGNVPESYEILHATSVVLEQYLTEMYNR